VAKLSRFQNLEHQRPVRVDSGQAPLERFGEDAHAPKAAGPEVAPSPVAQRFAPATDDAVRLAQDDLSRLPSIECGACGTENGKFDVACRTCGTRMDTEATHARNLARLATFDEQQEREREQVGTRRAHELEQLTAMKADRRRQAEAMAREVAEQHRKPEPGGRPQVKGSTFALGVLVLVVIVSNSLPVSLLAAVGALAIIGAKLGLLGKTGRFPWF